MAKNFPRLFLFPYRNSGSILVTSVWVLAFFIILTIGLYSIVSSQIRLTARFQNIAIGQHLARSTCVYALAKRKEEKESYDVLYKLRQRQEIELDNEEATYVLIDEESKININTVSSGIIKRLLEATAGLSEVSAQELSESLVNYRLEHPFNLKEEVLNVEGMKEDIFNACKDYITVYGKGEININTASPEALRAFGLENDIIEVIENFRLGPDGKKETEDDGYFENTGEIVDKIRSFKMLSEKEESELVSLVSGYVIVVKSGNFTLQIETKILGKPGMNYSVVVDSKNKIREWSEY